MNYIGYARTNYVKFKDVDKAKEYLEGEFGLRLIGRISNDEDFYGFVSADGWPWSKYDDELDEETEMDLGYLASLLEEGQVLIIEEVGHEGDRYYVGTSTAIAWDGRQIFISLSQMVEKVFEQFGVHTTSADY